ncbi:hypothetical protein [Corynebacterium glyciniphilum]|uniref:hypothetical protein n=1 Tax=Corynebacterium glyciniphilum TaxID=1404244 RepID=UPI00265223A6|nr:hypothetical protein [Corynebacterium glyciniphilum]MDN5682711.1 hypothetical protein [Corynebacterium glyciniphilum]
MKRIPNLPRPVPEITVGATVTGSDVIDCRIVFADAPEGTADRDPGPVWLSTECGRSVFPGMRGR